MFKFSLITVRPNTETPFFINTAEGQVYENIMSEIRSTKPSSEDQEDALLEFVRIESPDGLTVTASYTFNTSIGKDALFNDFDARYIADDMIAFQSARNTYNEANGHSTTVQVDVI